MRLLINVLFFLICFIKLNDSFNCLICIIDSTCDDDYIHFNISISNSCHYPLNASFSYTTEVESTRHYIYTQINCQNCFYDLSIDPVRDAWDYTLKVESPNSTNSCSMRTARCGGSTSRYIWIGTVCISGLFVLIGFLLCSIRWCRKLKQESIEQKRIEENNINS